VLQVQTCRFADPTKGIDALSLHEALKIESARVQEPARRIQPQSLDMHDISG